MQPKIMFGIQDKNGYILTSCTYYGDDRQVTLFETKEMAERQIVTFYRDKGYKVKRIKVLV